MGLIGVANIGTVRLPGLGLKYEEGCTKGSSCPILGNGGRETEAEDTAMAATDCGSSASLLDFAVEGSSIIFRSLCPDRLRSC